MKFKVKLYLFIALVLVLMCFVGYTYSRYRDEASGDISADVSPWKIYINNADVSGANTQNLNVTPILDNKASTLNGKWAPGSTGYFDIAVDDTKTTLSHEINFYADASDNDTRIEVTNIKECASPGVSCGSIPTLGTNEYVIQRIYNGTSFTTSYYRVYVSWYNSAANSERDTNVGSTQSTTSIIRVSVTVSQLNQ